MERYLIVMRRPWSLFLLALSIVLFLLSAFGGNFGLGSRAMTTILAAAVAGMMSWLGWVLMVGGMSASPVFGRLRLINLTGKTVTKAKSKQVNPATPAGEPAGGSEPTVQNVPPGKGKACPHSPAGYYYSQLYGVETEVEIDGHTLTFTHEIPQDYSVMPPPPGVELDQAMVQDVFIYDGLPGLSYRIISTLYHMFDTNVPPVQTSMLTIDFP